MANPGRDAAANVINERCLPAARKFARLRGRERSVSSRLGTHYSSRFHVIGLKQRESPMGQVQVEQKSYQMPPKDGITIAHFLTVADVERSLQFYETVFGGRVESRGDRRRAGVHPDREHVAHRQPRGRSDARQTNGNAPRPPDPDKVSSFMNIRVADIQACYKLWRSRGAEFITEPKPKYGETRCYIRDPDGYIIEVGQSNPGVTYG